MSARTTMPISGFRGDVVVPDHRDYDDARAVWNGTVDRRPRLIARCSGTADVAAAVRFARDRDLEIAVRGGGHNVAGTAVCDDGIVIDLSAMRAVYVDPVERTALVQGGALWGDVDHETQAHGLATTGGIVSHTGVGGVSLGGGIGWLMRKHGLTVDNLIQAEVVTAEGEIVGASASGHPELFWALRGGGGNFGVVSSFRFALHPVGPTVMAGPVFWAAEDTADVLHFYREFVTDAPDELGNVVRLGTIPPLPGVGEDLHFRPAIAVASCYAGPVEDGERAVRALRQFGNPLVDLVGPTLYVDHQSGLDDTVPHGWHYYWKATSLTRLSDEVIDIVAAHAYRATSPEVVHGDVPHGWRNTPSPARRHDLPGARCRSQHHHRRSLAPRAGRHRQGIGDRVGPSIPRRPVAPSCRRLRELPRLRRRHEPCPRGIRRGHVPAARRGESQIRPRERVPQQQEHPAQHAGAVIAHRTVLQASGGTRGASSLVSRSASWAALVTAWSR
jgi:FAD binding domain